MIQTYTLLGVLGFCAVDDMRNKRVLLHPALSFAIVGLLLHIWFQNISVYSMLAGILIGIVFLGISRVTRGKIGMGDGVVLVVSGIYLGFLDNMELLLHGLLFCGIWSLFLLVFRKKKKEDEVPFVPFLFLAYVEMLLLQH